MAGRIKITDSYIRQQSEIHRRILDQMHYEYNGFGMQLGFNIERRQLNMNLDDFYKNLAKDDVSVSSEEYDGGERREEEEVKVMHVSSRQFEENKLDQLAQYRLNYEQQLIRQAPQQRIVPDRRVFLDVD